MKSKISSMMLLPFIMGLGMTGCDKDKDLLRYLIPGKWKLVAEGHTEEVKPVTPNETFTEYFTNVMATYGHQSDLLQKQRHPRNRYVYHHRHR